MLKDIKNNHFVVIEKEINKEVSMVRCIKSKNKYIVEKKWLKEVTTR